VAKAKAAKVSISTLIQSIYRVPMGGESAGSTIAETIRMVIAPMLMVS
jgi:hypothetical protein